jgi:hypothetical protein
MAAPKGNKYAIGNRGGRPPLYETPEKLGKEIDRYFEYIKGEKERKTMLVMDQLTNKSEMKEVEVWIREKEKPTMFGLLLFLGFHSMQAFDHYEEKNDEFLITISRGKQRIAKWYEECLTEKGIARGAAFALGAIVGWGTKNEVQYFGKDGKPVDPPQGGATLITLMPGTQKEL